MRKTLIYFKGRRLDECGTYFEIHKANKANNGQWELERRYHCFEQAQAFLMDLVEEAA